MPWQVHSIRYFRRYTQVLPIPKTVVYKTGFNYNTKLLFMAIDEVFKDELSKPSDFKFNRQVAVVFDDMVNRSVPFYEEIQRMVAEIAADHYIEGTNVYDLGCSTGTTMI